MAMASPLTGYGRTYWLWSHLLAMVAPTGYGRLLAKASPVGQKASLRCGQNASRYHYTKVTKLTGDPDSNIVSVNLDSVAHASTSFLVVFSNAHNIIF
ncbi:hypothetical protein X797_008749 [Metarhizium robertsii]|uniref:Uncharacterized protein n=1 Tax=Metarhizium robertsii TaxID=568076 RepID=A0A0A1UQM3_9HYPO|nr:hypothetical protein X797_008749 [Metarhizium robertsii]